MGTFQVFVPGIGIVIVRAPDQNAAIQAAQTAAGNLGIPNPQAEFRGTINSAQEINNFAGAWLVNSQGGVISQLNNLASQGMQDVINAFVTGQLDQGQNQIEETTNPAPSGGNDPTNPTGTTQGPTGGQTTVTQPGTPTGQAGGFNPAFGVGTSFPLGVFQEALKNIGLDTTRPGMSFINSLFQPTQSAEIIGSLLGRNQPSPANPTQSPVANFTQGAFAGGPQTFANEALNILRELAGTTNQNLGQFLSPETLGTNEAVDVQNLASGALLSKLSPTAYASYGNQLVGNVANRFGREVASGNAPFNFAQYFLDNLRL